VDDIVVEVVVIPWLSDPGIYTGADLRPTLAGTAALCIVAGDVLFNECTGVSSIMCVPTKGCGRRSASTSRCSLTARRRRRYRRTQQVRIAALMIAPRTPPTTPPITAEWFVDDDRGLSLFAFDMAVEVELGDESETKMVTVWPEALVVVCNVDPAGCCA
jgi:hypothetical protein